MAILLPGRKTLLLLTFYLLRITVSGQLVVSGTVYDSTKQYVVPGVIVKSTGGATTLTDSLGNYHISVTDKDSLSFLYAGKPTQKFPVRAMNSYNGFDISLQVRVFEKYRLLKEVRVYANTYRQDSLENRANYARIFNFQKPTLRSNSVPGSPPGLDLDELISIFRFRRNKMTLQIQQRLMAEEEDKYVDYRFSKTLLKRVTGLSGSSLDKYRFLYRPTYEFVALATELEFYEYILKTAAVFKKQEGLN